MLIRWFGQSCFLLQDSLGRRFITDPFNFNCAENLLDLKPEIITVSHNHHNSTIPIKIDINCNILKSDTTYHLNNANISGYLTYHDNLKGSKRGSNIIFTFFIDNLKLCHLGHLGHPLPDNLIKDLYQADILFIPIGGHFTINYLEALNIIHKLKPKIIIPMYYKTSKSLPFLDSPNLFLKHMNNVLSTKDGLFDTNSLTSNSTPLTLLLKESNIFL